MALRPLPLLVAPLLALTLGAATPPLPTPRPAGEVLVSLTSARNARGVIRLCLTAVPAAFPRCERDPAARTLTVPANATSARFDHVAPGTYAVAALHDENGNGRMDMALMMPREGFGFSRNPAMRMGPPRFAEASFAVTDAAVRQSIRLRYLL